jgi:hypothetical protein
MSHVSNVISFTSLIFITSYVIDNYMVDGNELFSLPNKYIFTDLFTYFILFIIYKHLNLC